ncbi:MAG: CvpA family protein [Bacteroidales bacterium]|nr:CvpA family protein [Bacteroidales bacterium]
MSIVDIILLICFIPALISGIRKGFISQVISIVSIIAGVWVSFKFSTQVGEWLGQHIEAAENVLKLISFVIIMIAVFAGLALIGKLLEGLIKFVMLGWVNKLLGVVFALLKTGLIVGLLIMVFCSLNNNLHLVSDDILAESVLFTPLKNIAYTVFPYLKSLIFWN